MVSLRLPRSLWGAVKAFADEEGLLIAEAVREILRGEHPKFDWTEWEPEGDDGREDGSTPDDDAE